VTGRALLGSLAAGLLAGCGVEGAVFAPDPVAIDAGLYATASPDAGTVAATDAPSFVAVSAVSAGQIATCALVASAPYCWGSNPAGGLGDGTTQDRSAPVPVTATVPFAAIAVGDVHSCGLEATGRIDCWGGNADGQLGLGDTTSRGSPSVVGLGRDALEVSAGYEFTCAVAADRSLWCWGENDEGQVGQGDSPGAANVLAPLEVGVGTEWLHVASGQGHACGIEAPGALWCWGRNTAGELGLGPGQPIQIRAPTQVGSDTDWESLDLGQDSACAIKRSGTLWCWGSDASSQLGFPGDPDAAEANIPVPTQVGTDADWAQVSIDTFDACAIKQNGTLWCWGRNQEGQLGMGDTVDRAAPAQVGTETTWGQVSVGRFHTCAGKVDGTVLCTGKNDSGALGVGDTTDRDTFTAVPLPASH
jgi:alpha-tubulin suppressor-like RCC1 family protein